MTRLIEDNCEDRLYFQKKGFETIEIPLLSLKIRKLEQTFETMLEKSEWIFLTSQHGAEFFFQQILTDRLQHTLESKKFAVIGEKTANILLKNNVEIDFLSPNPTKASLFKSWTACEFPPTTIFYPKSNLADNNGEAELVQTGQCLLTTILYDNFFSEKNRQRLKQYLLDEKIAAVYLASPSLWRRFLSVFIETGLKNIPDLYCLGDTTKQVIIEDGYEVRIKAKA
ncbi:hypothetical protein RV12_GL000439 [Enterococcus quebecensis]|nr:hypothetical protein RV12_GL000439 [Enterococcus quebecensis]